MVNIKHEFGTFVGQKWHVKLHLDRTAFYTVIYYI